MDNKEQVPFHFATFSSDPQHALRIAREAGYCQNSAPGDDTMQQQGLSPASEDERRVLEAERRALEAERRAQEAERRAQEAERRLASNWMKVAVGSSCMIVLIMICVIISSLLDTNSGSAASDSQSATEMISELGTKDTTPNEKPVGTEQSNVSAETVSAERGDGNHSDLTISEPEVLTAETADTQQTEPIQAKNGQPLITDVDETVYAVSDVNVRDCPAAQGSYVIGVLSCGQSVKRTGTTNNGWSRVDYNGKTAYVVSMCLSTSKNEQPVITDITDVDEMVYAVYDVNVRDWPGIQGSYVIGTLSCGQSVKRTGITNNGWSQVDYNGKTAYVVSEYLSISKNDVN